MATVPEPVFALHPASLADGAADPRPAADVGGNLPSDSRRGRRPARRPHSARLQHLPSGAADRPSGRQRRHSRSGSENASLAPGLHPGGRRRRGGAGLARGIANRGQRRVEEPAGGDRSRRRKAQAPACPGQRGLLVDQHQQRRLDRARGIGDPAQRGAGLTAGTAGAMASLPAQDAGGLRCRIGPFRRLQRADRRRGLRRAGRAGQLRDEPVRPGGLLVGDRHHRLPILLRHGAMVRHPVLPL